jgi:shikimate dehydrogenase
MNFTIYGNPISHSKSPQMHNAGFKQIKFNGTYTKTHLEDGKQLKQNFLTHQIQGANITVPHKEDAFNQADEIIGLAKVIGAVNTYINCNGIIKAYNTDAPGFMKSIEEFDKVNNILILGAGGTAKAISVALKGDKIDTTIINRSKNRLKFFKDIGCKVFSWDDIYSIQNIKYDLIINSTSAGLKDDNYPIDQHILEILLSNANYAIDCIYGKMTPFLKLAKQEGVIYKDGEDMLLFQGVLAFELFTGVKADDSLVKAMRKGLKES